MNEKILLRGQDLTMKFDQKIVFNEINFSIAAGDFFCIVGPNGSGKTTLLKIIMGDLTPSSGQLTRNVNVHKISYIPQFRNLESDYPLSAKAFVELKLSHGICPWFNRKEKEAVFAALQRTHLLAKQNLRIGQMSGGEKQLVYLAQAIVDRPRVLVLDESTASLDEHAKFEVMDVVQELNDNGTTIIFISHDPELLAKYGNSKLELKGGAK